MKPSLTHGLVDERVVAKGPQVDTDVAVLGGLRYGYKGTTRMEVDSLRSDHDDRLAVLVERNQSVQERRTRENQDFVTAASRAHSAPSNRGARGLPRARDLVR